MAAYALHAAKEIDLNEPATYEEAINHLEAENWLLAMKEEMESLYKNQTWKLVELPKGRHVVGCKWIFKRKPGLSEKEGIRYKARLVAKGFSQKEGVYFNKIFSPVVRHTSIRVLLAIVANQDLELEQLQQNLFPLLMTVERIYRSYLRLYGGTSIKSPFRYFKLI